MNVVLISGNQTALFLTEGCGVVQHVKPPRRKIYSKSASGLNQQNQEISQHPEAWELLGNLNHSVYSI